MRFDAAHPLSDEAAFGLLDVDAEDLASAARAVRDRIFGKTLTYSPKVFLPVTNLCRDKCGYCSFRRSPGDAGEWTMSPDEIDVWLDRGRAQGCAEALLCLGDRPESAFPTYKRTLATWGHSSTTDYLVAISERALDRGLLPHTNAGILTREEMARLAPLNVSMGLMLETTSERLGRPGEAHHRAPDKRPAVRIKMIDEAGALGIAFTTGILVGIGETPRERIDALLAIRKLHRAHGHIQEVIVQSFRAHPSTRMNGATEPTDAEMTHAIALARLILDSDVSVQAPPNLAGSSKSLVDAGIDDFGGISAVTPDYINPRHPWPHLDALRAECASRGFSLAPRLAIHDRFARLVPKPLRQYVQSARDRLGGPSAASRPQDDNASIATEVRA